MPSSARSRGDRSASRPSGIGQQLLDDDALAERALEVVVHERDPVHGAVAEQRAQRLRDRRRIAVARAVGEALPAVQELESAEAQRSDAALADGEPARLVPGRALLAPVGDRRAQHLCVERACETAIARQDAERTDLRLPPREQGLPVDVRPGPPPRSRARACDRRMAATPRSASARVAAWTPRPARAPS